jgi:hypothetical protein
MTHELMSDGKGHRKVFDLSNPWQMFAKLQWEVDLLRSMWPKRDSKVVFAAFNAATTAWHLCDWIETYPELHPNSGLEIDPSKYKAKVFERCPWLKICGQIANGWKHRIINRTNVPEIQANSVINIFAKTDANGNPSGPFEYEQSYAVLDGQQHIELTTLFETVLNFWNDELKRLKLSPCGSGVL